MLVIWATARPGVETDLLENALLEDLEGLTEVGEEEVDRAFNLIEARRLIGLQRVDERADQLSMFSTLFDDPGQIGRASCRRRAERRSVCDGRGGGRGSR